MKKSKFVKELERIIDMVKTGMMVSSMVVKSFSIKKMMMTMKSW
nr:MAG: hypothetical protein [Bacteriophage sp.]